ncbi:MAG: HupE/UreJ family protein [Rubrivivax sp.]|nr:HupE/UreJ family protein [Rubrivivax sp.]
MVTLRAQPRGPLRGLRRVLPRGLLSGLLSALLWAGLVPSAAAHQASDALLNLRWLPAAHGQPSHESLIEQRLDIALRDLDREWPLDGDGDGSLRWGEVLAQWPQIQALAAQGVTLHAGARPCHAGRQGVPQLVQHGEQAHAVLQTRWSCPADGGPLTLRYTLFQQTDAGHRGLLRVAGAGARDALVVLAPGDTASLPRPHRDAGSGLGDAAQAAVASTCPGCADSAPAPRTGPGAIGFFLEGLRHIGSGLDHLLFLASLLVVAVCAREDGRWVPRRSAAAAWAETARLVTAFTLAHSLTLALAVAGVLAPPARWVESLVAASLLLAALDNLRPLLPGPRWGVVAVFGAVHGFGFAGPLQALGLQRGELALPLLAFNLGVEAGQLLLVALLLPLALAWRHAPAYRVGVVQGGSAAVALLATAWTAQRVLDTGPWR